MILLECIDCTAPYAARSTRSTRCAACRLGARLAVVASARLRRRKCSLCTTPFLPSHSHDHYLCGACEAQQMPTGLDVDCVICRQRRQAVLPELTVCIVCAKDPEKREALQRGLAKGRRDRTAKYEAADARATEVLALWDRRQELADAFARVSAAEKARRKTRDRAREAVDDADLPSL